MKRRGLIAKLENTGCHLLLHGSRRDIYHNPGNGRSEPDPRHKEISELLAKKILKSLVP